MRLPFTKPYIFTFCSFFSISFYDQGVRGRGWGNYQLDYQGDDHGDYHGDEHGDEQGDEEVKE